MKCSCAAERSFSSEAYWADAPSRGTSTRILRWGSFGAVFCGASAEWMEKGRGSGRYQALGVTAVLQ